MDRFSARGKIFSLVIVAVISLLMGRLVQLQVLNSSEYTGESRTNAIREIRVLPARGTLIDRNGQVLVDTEPAYSVVVTPRYFDPEKLPELADILEIEEADLEARLEAARSWNQYLPSPVLNGVSFDRISRLLEHIDELPGVNYEATQKRRYLTPVRASHALGYVREITGPDLEARREDGYRAGDVIGQRGVERIYEAALRGRMGSDFRLMNVHRQDVSAFRDGAEDVAPVAGRDLVLTLDADLQALAESLFVGKRGAVVALEPSTGEILALVSKPDFDLRQFSRQMTRDTWAQLSASKEKPLFNRATQSELMPGSTWKPLIALIALQAGVVKPTERFYCPGYHEVGRGRFFRCMHVHGSIDVFTAVQESCNTFFFEMMRRLDVNTFARHAREFGFGSRINSDFTEEVKGLIPDSSYFNRIQPDWTVGYAMNLGVGQGTLGVTPMQLARYVAAVGNGGVVTTPHLLKAVADPVTGVFEDVAEPETRRVSIDAPYIDLVRRAMRGVMENGTGRFLAIPGITSGAKTGTAQNSRGKDDSVFIMFAPFDNPQIALAVLVENAGFGGSAAGPIASLMAERYLTGQVTRDALVERIVNLKSDPLPEAE